MADERVVFTRPDAERIARAVRRVEGMREGQPLQFRRSMEDLQKKVFRMATFTGAWAIDASKTVTFRNQTATPNTASVVNLLMALPDAGQRNCAIAKEGSAWYLVNWQWNTAVIATSATVSGTAVTFIGVPGGVVGSATATAFTLPLQASTALSAVTLTTAALTFNRISVFSLGTASTVAITTTTCTT